MNSLLGEVKTHLGLICNVSALTNLILHSPLSHDWCMERNVPFSLAGMVGLFKLSYEQGIVSTQNRCHMDL
jgi:hypothetical protein